MSMEEKQNSQTFLDFNQSTFNPSTREEIVEIIKEEVSTTLGLVGLNDINEVTSEIVIENTINKVNY